MIKVANNLPGVIKDDPAPEVAFSEFGESSINVTLYFWIHTQKTDYRSTLDAAVKNIKLAFEQAGINIPYPTRTVYMEQG